MRWYDPVKIGGSRMARQRDPHDVSSRRESREGDHFAAAVGLRSYSKATRRNSGLGHRQHTMKGKAMGRGLDHFREQGAKLIPPPTEPDPYIEEAYRLWTMKQQGK